ncbi:hypothetical protein [Desulfotomaculum sp. 1211_IL3151]|uniref:hypothetical protein n=1 Tax=Desulfotomaculum sp. 1211_IL3151 TaxID=3084055 RepID=UPI002FD972C1
MVTGKIALLLNKEDHANLQLILEQLTGILQCQRAHKEFIVIYDRQRIDYDQILQTTSQAGYRISRFYVAEEEC